MSTENTPIPDTAPTEDTRKKRLMLLGVITLVVLVLYGLYWLFHARFMVDTDNAYVQGNVVQITPQVGGTVVAIEADDTDTVKAGQMLVRLDPVDTRVALDQAEAQLAQTVREVRATYLNDQALASTQSMRRAEYERLTQDLARRQELVEGGAVSVEEIEHLKTAVATARSATQEAEQQQARNATQTEGVTVETHPRVLAAASRYREAWLAFKRAGIVAPIGGTVARRSVQVGQRVASGVPLMAIVPLEQLWVDANFKESQLAQIRIGQPVKLRADVYGSSVDFDGKVMGLGAGTGSAFSLLPAQNATGNWIKVVQRVPVRVALDPQQVAEHPLRVGLSMVATIDTHDRSGRLVTEAGQSNPVAQTDVYDNLTQTADERVNAIVSANLGHRVRMPHAKP